MSRQIALGHFSSPEPEYVHLGDWISEGDWVLDVGANVGHYTAELSRQVGPHGRVISFEPVPETFAVLAWNLQILGLQNVSLVNAAASESWRLASITMPFFATGLPNFYQAELSEPRAGSLNVMTVSIDDFEFPARIAFVKIDVEGHELDVLKGMSGLLARDRPVLIVETAEAGAARDFVEKSGYSIKKFVGSPNIIGFPIP